MEEFLLNTGSTIEEGRLAKGGSKLTDDYTEECAVCEMNLEDYLALGSPDRVMVTSQDGHSVVVYAYADQRVHVASGLHAQGHLVECSGGPGDLLHRLAALQGLSGQDRTPQPRRSSRRKNWL